MITYQTRNEQRDKQIFECHQRGESCTFIARKFGITKVRVHAIVKQHLTLKHWNRFFDETSQRIADLAIHNVPLKKIADELDLPEVIVSEIAKQNRINIPRLVDVLPGLQSMSPTQISKVTGFSRVHIIEQSKLLNIQLPRERKRKARSEAS